jgi:hypothetical protein
MASNPLLCTGTLVEHVLGPAECTDDGCTSAPEEHWLVVRCVEVECRCVQDNRSDNMIGHS